MQHTKLDWVARSFAILGTLGLVIGCAAPGPDSGELEPGPRMQVRKGCLRNACQQRVARESRACSDCTSACFSAGYDCDVSTACDYSCESSAPCSEWEREECVSEGFEVVLPNNPNEAIATSCDRMLSRVRECGAEPALTATDCDRYALLERADVVSHYECYAALSCDQLLGDADPGCSPPPSTFGDTFCAAFTGLCGEACPEELRSWLNADGAWWRDDVLQAGLTCSEQATCDDAVDCLEVWADAVLGD